MQVEVGGMVAVEGLVGVDVEIELIFVVEELVEVEGVEVEGLVEELVEVEGVEVEVKGLVDVEEVILSM